MANFSPTDSFDVTGIAEIQATDRVLASFINAYYQKFINNDYALKVRNDKEERVVYVSLPASGWSGVSAPYTQTVSVDASGTALPFVATDKPILVKNDIGASASLATQKAYNKAYGILSSGRGEVGAGTVTFHVWKTISTDIIVGLKGV